MKEKKHVKPQLLLLEDITNLGRKGDIVRAKPGFIRNFLLPQKKAVIADKRTLRMQDRLKEERAKQAEQDKKNAQAIAVKLKELTLSMTTKTDIHGNLYGSVSQLDIVKTLAADGIDIERKHVVLNKSIKKVGVFDINLKLKEGVHATFKLKVKSDQVLKDPTPHIDVIEEGQVEKDSSNTVDEETGESFPTSSDQDKEVKAEVEERSK